MRAIVRRLDGIANMPGEPEPPGPAKADSEMVEVTPDLILRSARSVRLEGWVTDKVLMPTLRDAALRAAPQGEVILCKRDVL